MNNSQVPYEYFGEPFTVKIAADYSTICTITKYLSFYFGLSGKLNVRGGHPFIIKFIRIVKGIVDFSDK